MSNALFSWCFALVMIGAVLWGARTLPGESWQFAAAVPLKKRGDGAWGGLNLTYYGVFSSGAQTLAAATAIFLASAAGYPLWGVLALCMLLFAVCVPAARIVARLVEGKKHTLTIGGASFVGFVLLPWAAWAVSLVHGRFAGGAPGALSVMSALAVAYAVGEGMGRLACMSYGCCYGKPLDEAHPLLRRVFSPMAFVFTGPCKKIAYAHGWEGRPVVPVQAVTALVYCSTGALGAYLHLEGRHAAAFCLAVTVTQAWRLVSEFFRADYRGGGKISAYQIMTMAAVPYCLLAPVVFQAGAPVPGSVARGFAVIWNPAMLLFLQTLWLALFLNVGRSTTTASTVSFHVVGENV
jgi:prolipoprotein diacylglyceryltransferase